jgi:hypothetical protein
MLALIGYPLIVERKLKLAQQSWVWSGGYLLLMLLTAGCAALLWRSRGIVAAAGGISAAELPAGAEDRSAIVPTLGLRLGWLILSFVPSSLLLGVTTYISTDIAAVPLLWVMPLALYLLTFVIVFARWPAWFYRCLLQRWPKAPWLAGIFHPHWICFWVQPALIVLLALVIFETITSSMGWVILLHLGAFFVTAMLCHGELARSRPAARYLTEFYIWMSVGGVLGGAFNALVAPLAFSNVPIVIEYPLVIILACMLRPTLLRPRYPAVSRWLDLILPLGVFAALFVLKSLSQGWHLPAGLQWLDCKGWS